MLTVSTFTVENLSKGCITDCTAPVFSFALTSNENAVRLQKAIIICNGWMKETDEQVGIKYDGPALRPHTDYRAYLQVFDNRGQTAISEVQFRTAKLNEPWRAAWITDGELKLPDKKNSPPPVTIYKRIVLCRKPIRAEIFSTALGIYELCLNGKKIGEDYFAPGFTSYRKRLQYNVYDITDMLAEGSNELTAVLGGGWAVGSFTHKRISRIFADKQAFLGEIRLEYSDGTSEIIGTDESWEIVEKGNYIFGDFYDGEIYDANVDLHQSKKKPVTIENVKISPVLSASCGASVKVVQEVSPVSTFFGKKGEVIYDFGQNFAGVVNAKLQGKRGDKVVFRHAEILQNGTLCTAPLRSAKATATYFCKDGLQQYSPKLTYMGFRYVEVTGIAADNIQLTAFVLSSDMPSIGGFICSDIRLNKLNENIRWSARSNFIDIPTDCPQRDERMGWTGDIAVFAPTACYNFDTSRFFDKWLADLRAEQSWNGGIPVIIPHIKVTGVFETEITFPIDFWGDSCILVPWAEYMARGDIHLLKKMYPTMKKYIKGCKKLAELFSFGIHRRIWQFHHYGDWCAPGLDWKGWMRRGKWTATACLCHSSAIVSKIAGILGYKADELYFKKYSNQVAKAYRKVFTDGKGRLKNEFQTAYVLPLYFNIFSGKERVNAANHLAELVKQIEGCIATGFPGTPYILFALADNGHTEDAFNMLLNEKCPSWLYEVKAGATTIWERWDGLAPNGALNIIKGGTESMISFNHYASGAVGDFLYKRIAGIEPTKGGYKSFQIKPLIGGGLSYAKGWVSCPYGKILSCWHVENGKFTIHVSVPVSTECTLVLPSGAQYHLQSGRYSYSEKL